MMDPLLLEGTRVLRASAAPSSLSHQASSTLQYRYLVAGLENNGFYVRVFSQNFDSTWGPPRWSDPLVTTPRRAIVDVVQGGQNIPLANGLVLLKMVNLGSGPFAAAVPVTAQMVNGTGGRSYNVRAVDVEGGGAGLGVWLLFLVGCAGGSSPCLPPPCSCRHRFPFNLLRCGSLPQATNCQFDIDGERVVCDTPEGVGADFQWAVTVRGQAACVYVCTRLLANACSERPSRVVWCSVTCCTCVSAVPWGTSR
jgi:hypothetical protein